MDFHQLMTLRAASHQSNIIECKRKSKCGRLFDIYYLLAVWIACAKCEFSALLYGFECPASAHFRVFSPLFRHHEPLDICWDSFFSFSSLALYSFLFPFLCSSIRPMRGNDWWWRYFYFCLLDRRSSFWLFILMVRFSFHLAKIRFSFTFWLMFDERTQVKHTFVRSIVICEYASKAALPLFY